jgi:hypothetical protein
MIRSPATEAPARAPSKIVSSGRHGAHARVPSPLNLGLWYPRASIGAAVIAAHVLFLALVGTGKSTGPAWRIGVSGEPFVTAEVIVQPSMSRKVLIAQSEPDMLTVAMDAPSLMQVGDPQVSDSEEGSLGPATSAATSPRLAPSQSADVREYAQRAGVAPGNPLIVVLSVRVGTDGIPGPIAVLRSCGSEAADRAAIDYAHLLRWIPGAIDGVPRSMLVILPVTLDASRQPAASFQRRATKLDTLSVGPMLSGHRDPLA